MPLHFESERKAPPTRERETLFTIDGRDCTIPVKFTPLEMARYAHTVRDAGPDAAAVFALELALGEKNYLAFLNLPHDEVSEEDWTRVVGLITGRLVGLDVEVPKDPVPAPAPLATEPPPSPEPAEDPRWPGPDASADRTPATPPVSAGS